MKITTLADFNKVIADIKKNKVAKTLEFTLAFSEFEEPGNITLLCEALKVVKYPTIKITNSNLPDETAAALIAALADNHHLTHLDLSGNNMGEASSHALAHLITNHESLVDLNVSKNPLGEGLASILGAAANAPEHFTKLDISTTNLKRGAPHSEAVATAITQVPARIKTIINSNLFNAEALSIVNVIQATHILGKNTCKQPKAIAKQASQVDAALFGGNGSPAATNSTASSSPSVSRSESDDAQPKASASDPSEAPPIPSRESLLYAVTDVGEYQSYFWSQSPDYPHLAYHKIANWDTFYTLAEATKARNSAAKVDNLEGKKASPVIYKILYEETTNKVLVASYSADDFTSAESETLIESTYFNEMIGWIIQSSFDTYQPLVAPSGLTTTGPSHSLSAMCSTSSTSSTDDSNATPAVPAGHGQVGAQRAKEFVDNVQALPSLTKKCAAIMNYMNAGRSTGNFDKGISYKAIVYATLANHYGTPEEKQVLTDDKQKITTQGLVTLLKRVFADITTLELGRVKDVSLATPAPTATATPAPTPTANGST